ncbi:MAG: hypothetical protein AAF570_24495 [Bacteroidota bacterium]
MRFLLLSHFAALVVVLHGICGAQPVSGVLPDSSGFWEGELLDGELHGAWALTYADGSTWTFGKLYRGFRTGWWRTFHPNGELKTAGECFVDSAWVEVLPENGGAILAEGDSVATPAELQVFITRYELPFGVMRECRDGTWYHFDEAGEMDRVQVYDQGRLVKEEVYRRRKDFPEKSLGD